MFKQENLQYIGITASGYVEELHSKLQVAKTKLEETEKEFKELDEEVDSLLHRIDKRKLFVKTLVEQKLIPTEVFGDPKLTVGEEFDIYRSLIKNVTLQTLYSPEEARILELLGPINKVKNDDELEYSFNGYSKHTGLKGMIENLKAEVGNLETLVEQYSELPDPTYLYFEVE